MLRTNDEQLKNLRNPEFPDEHTGIALPPRTSQRLFAGWGPKLLTAAITVAAALCASQPVSASTKVVALTSCAADHAAVLLSHPDVILPDGIYATGETVLRVDLAANGQISNISIAQSASDPVLDFAAMNVARTSSYQAASQNCQASGDSFLYRVVFSE